MAIPEHTLEISPSVDLTTEGDHNINVVVKYKDSQENPLALKVKVRDLREFTPEMGQIDGSYKELKERSATDFLTNGADFANQLSLKDIKPKLEGGYAHLVGKIVRTRMDKVDEFPLNVRTNIEADIDYSNAVEQLADDLAIIRGKGKISFADVVKSDGSDFPDDTELLRTEDDKPLGVLVSSDGISNFKITLALDDGYPYTQLEETLDVTLTKGKGLFTDLLGGYIELTIPRKTGNFKLKDVLPYNSIYDLPEKDPNFFKYWTLNGQPNSDLPMIYKNIAYYEIGLWLTAIDEELSYSDDNPIGHLKVDFWKDKSKTFDVHIKYSEAVSKDIHKPVFGVLTTMNGVHKAPYNIINELR